MLLYPVFFASLISASAGDFSSYTDELRSAKAILPTTLYPLRDKVWQGEGGQRRELHQRNNLATRRVGSEKRSQPPQEKP